MRNFHVVSFKDSFAPKIICLFTYVLTVLFTAANLPQGNSGLLEEIRVGSVSFKDHPYNFWALSQDGEEIYGFRLQLACSDCSDIDVFFDAGDGCSWFEKDLYNAPGGAGCALEENSPQCDDIIFETASLPTMNQWRLMVLGLIILMLGTITIYRFRKTSSIVE